MATRRTPRTKKIRAEAMEGDDQETDQGSVSESVSRATDTPKTLDNLEKWRKADLVVECRRRGLKAYGTKKDLRGRIRESIEMTANVSQVFEREETMEIEHLPEVERSEDGKEFEEVSTKRRIEKGGREEQEGNDNGKEGNGGEWGPGTAIVSASGVAVCSEEEAKQDVVGDTKNDEDLGQHRDKGGGEVKKPVTAPQELEIESMRDGNHQVFDRRIVEEIPFEATEATLAVGNNGGRIESADADREANPQHLSVRGTDYFNKQSEPAAQQTRLEPLNPDFIAKRTENEEANNENDGPHQHVLDGKTKFQNGDEFIATFSTSHVVEFEGVRGVAHVESKAVITGVDTEIDQEMKEGDQVEQSREATGTGLPASAEVGIMEASEGLHVEGKGSTADAETGSDSRTEGENVEVTTGADIKDKEPVEKTFLGKNTKEPSLDGSISLNIDESANLANKKSSVDTAIGSNLSTKILVQGATGSCDTIVPSSRMNGSSYNSKPALLSHKYTEDSNIAVEPENGALHTIQKPTASGNNGVLASHDSGIRSAENAAHAETTTLEMEEDMQHDLSAGLAAHIVSPGEYSIKNVVNELLDPSVDQDNEGGRGLSIVGQEKLVRNDEEKQRKSCNAAIQPRDGGGISREAQETNDHRDRVNFVQLNRGQNVAGNPPSNIKDASETRGEFKTESAIPETTGESGVLSQLESGLHQRTATVPPSPSLDTHIEMDVQKSIAKVDPAINNPEVGDLNESYVVHDEQGEEVNTRNEQRFNGPFVSSNPLKVTTNSDSFHHNRHDVGEAKVPPEKPPTVDLDDSKLVDKEWNSANSSKHTERPEQVDRGDHDTGGSCAETNPEATLAAANTPRPVTRIDCKTRTSFVGAAEGAGEDNPSHFSRMTNRTSKAVDFVEYSSATNAGAAYADSTGKEIANSEAEVEFNFSTTEYDSHRDPVTPIYEDDETFSESPLPSPRPWSHFHDDEANSGRVCIDEGEDFREEPLFSSSNEQQMPVSGKQNQASYLDGASIARAQVPKTTKSGYQGSKMTDVHNDTFASTKVGAQHLANEDDSVLFNTADANQADDVLMVEEDIRKEQELGSDHLEYDNACEESSSEQHEPEQAGYDAAGINHEVSGDDQSSDENAPNIPDEDSSAGNGDPADDAGNIILVENGSDDGQSGDSRSSQGSHAIGAVIQSEQRSPQGSWDSKGVGEPSPRSGASSNDEEEGTVFQPSRATIQDLPSSNEVYVISSDEDDDGGDSDSDDNGIMNNSDADADIVDYAQHIVLDQADEEEEQEPKDVDLDIEDEIIAKGGEVVAILGEDEAEGSATGRQLGLDKVNRKTVWGPKSTGNDHTVEGKRSPAIVGLGPSFKDELYSPLSKTMKGFLPNYVEQEPQTRVQTTDMGRFDRKAPDPVNIHGNFSRSQRGQTVDGVSVDDEEKSGLTDPSSNLAEGSRLTSPLRATMVAPSPPHAMAQNSLTHDELARRAELKPATIGASIMQHSADIEPPNSQGMKRRRVEHAQSEAGNQADVGNTAKDSERVWKRQRTGPPLVPVMEMPSAEKTLRALKMTRNPWYMQELDRADVSRCLDFDECGPPSILERLSQIEEGQTRKHFKPFRDTLRDVQRQVRKVPSSVSPSEVAFRMGSVSHRRRVVTQPSEQRKMTMRMLHSRPLWNVRTLAAQSLRRAQQVAQRVVRWQSEASPFDFEVANGFRHGNGNGSGNGKRTNIFSLEFEASGSARKRRK